MLIVRAHNALLTKAPKASVDVHFFTEKRKLAAWLPCHNAMPRGASLNIYGMVYRSRVLAPHLRHKMWRVKKGA